MALIPDIASNLHRIEDGLWASSNIKAVSYPESAHDAMFEIEDKSFWFRHRNDCIIEVVKHFPFDGPLFDVGGGNGYVSSGLIRDGIPTALLEPRAEGVANARKRGVSPIIHSTVEDAGFKSESVGAFGLFDTLEHVDDDEGFLFALRRILKPGGRLFLTLPAFNFLWSNEDDHAGHFRRYTLPGMASKLRKAGYIVSYATYFMMLIPAPVFVFRALPYKMGLRKAHRKSSLKKDLAGGSWFAERLISATFPYEVKKISRLEKLPFGGSLLIAAEKLSGGDDNL